AVDGVALLAAFQLLLRDRVRKFTDIVALLWLDGGRGRERIVGREGADSPSGAGLRPGIIAPGVARPVLAQLAAGDRVRLDRPVGPAVRKEVARQVGLAVLRLHGHVLPAPGHQQAGAGEGYDQ